MLAEHAGDLNGEETRVDLTLRRVVSHCDASDIARDRILRVRADAPAMAYVETGDVSPNHLDASLVQSCHPEPPVT
jgi:uncharacterized protein (DUF427 family)